MCVLIKIKNREESFLGGASLIAPGIVLTAAHKLDKINPDSLMVRCGVFDRQNNLSDYPWQELKIDRVTVHPAYYKNLLTNNYALLHVHGEFNLTERVGTICLPDSPDLDVEANPKECVATGFGKDNFNGALQETLKQVDLPIVKSKECQEMLKLKNGDDFVLDPSYLCAGGNDAGGDTCSGDGGGPLVCKEKGDQSPYFQVQF